jgi:uncharacterized protein
MTRRIGFYCAIFFLTGIAVGWIVRPAQRTFYTVQEIAAALAKKFPVILDIQAWPESSSGRIRWDTDWEDGHYVIALGLDNTNLYVEDPSLLGCRGFIPLKEFESRWHDYKGDPPYDPSKRSYVRMAMFIEGKERSSPTPLCRVN